MAMTVKRRKDSQTARVFVHKIADVRGGVSVVTSELPGDYLAEGTVISAPDNGKCHVVKTAVAAAVATATATKVKVNKGHHLAKGDVVMLAKDGKAITISDIDRTDPKCDELTLSAALGAVAVNDVLAEAKAVAAESGAELKYKPFALVGTGAPVDPKSNLATDAWLIGVTHGNKLPAYFYDDLKGIINY